MEFLSAIKDILVPFFGLYTVNAIFIIIAIILFIQFIYPIIQKIFHMFYNTKRRCSNLLSIAEEFKNNHGSSMRDAIDRIEKNTSQVKEDLRLIDGRLNAVVSIIGDNQMSVGVYETDELGNCIYTNGKWSEITGMSTDDARSYGWINSIHPEDRERVQENWDYAVKHSSRFDMIYRLIDVRTQNIIKVRGYAQPIKGSNNQTIRFIGVVLPLDEDHCSICPHTKK